MTTGLSTYNCTIQLKKKGGANNSYESDITNFSETAIDKRISYSQVISGLIVPKIEETIYKEVTFDFVIGGVDLERFIDDTYTNKVVDWDNTDQYRIVITFTNGIETYIKAYYNAYVKILDTYVENEVLKGKITFTLPIKDISGKINFAVYESLTDLSAKDIEMGY